MAAVNDDVSGVYTCTPYNSYGTMGSSGPTDVILKVSATAHCNKVSFVLEVAVFFFCAENAI